MIEDKPREEEERRHERLVVLGLLGAFGFSFPLLGLVGDAGTLLGIPRLVLYVFSAWGLFIVLLAVALRDARRPGARRDGEDGDAR